MITTSIKETLIRTLPQMEGWCHPDKGLKLAEYILEHKPRTLVELGVFGGASLVAMGLAAKTYGGQVYGVDTWNKRDCMAHMDVENAEWWSKIDYGDIRGGCLDWLSRLGLLGTCQLIQETTLMASTRFQSIDFLHLDGNHSEWDSSLDVLLWVPKLSADAFLFFDDMDWVTTKTAQNFCAKECDLVETIKTTNECGVWRKR